MAQDRNKWKAKCKEGLDLASYVPNLDDLRTPVEVLPVRLNRT